MLEFSNLIKIARAAMKEGCSKHALFAISYTNCDGFYTEETAASEDEIKYFFNDKAFNAYVDELRDRYASFGITDVNFYAIHER